MSVHLKSSSQQVQDVMLSAIVNVIWTIWHCRNCLRFDNKVIPFNSAKSLIMSNVSLSGNCSKGSMKSAIQDFMLLKKFSVSIHHGPAPCIKQVDWRSPLAFGSNATLMGLLEAPWVIQLVEGFLETTMPL